ncbi:Low-density lipoprotein receptor-related protein 1B [Labeo rohita]|uniref:Low-density lipoprotein receptor-related protein 1B n=1 Tax=Labeo rohita TaxID=84645 RepID=A0ABQ8LKK9_LABRO|nr:Low-density lipoprotein receptor-related protein 1B [Labeo rohita]
MSVEEFHQFLPPHCSDPAIFFGNECSVRKGGCSHECLVAPGKGVVCSCPSGFHLGSDGRTCEALDYCTKHLRCSQVCEQHKNTVKCSCYPGWSLGPDGDSCYSTAARIYKREFGLQRTLWEWRGRDAQRALNPFEAFIIFSIRHEIRRINLHRGDYSLLVPGLRNTIALDFHFSQSLLYWTDVVEDKIYRGKLSEGGGVSSIEVVVQHGLATPEGLAVDWIAGNLYWIDSNLDQIEVSKLNGELRTTLIAGGMEHPRAIAVDPGQGALFWTDWDATFPRIEGASMSGKRRHVVFKDMDSGAWPNGLTLDHMESRIVWTDARSDAIYSALYDGTGMIEILRGHEFLSHPFAVSLFGGNVYWTDWRTNTLTKANKWTGANVTVIQKTSAQPFDLEIYHPSRQPQIKKNKERKKKLSYTFPHNFPYFFSCVLFTVWAMKSKRRARKRPINKTQLNQPVMAVQHLFPWVYICQMRKNQPSIVIGSYKATVWMERYAAQMCEGFFFCSWLFLSCGLAPAFLCSGILFIALDVCSVSVFITRPCLKRPARIAIGFQSHLELQSNNLALSKNKPRDCWVGNKGPNYSARPPNPCAGNKGRGPCSHLCLINYNGSASCSCPHLMKLSANNRSCQGVKKFLLYARRSEIRGVDIDNPYLNVIMALTVPDIDDVTAMDYDAVDERIYWADVKTRTIKRAFINGTKLETVLSGGTPRSIWTVLNLHS